MNRRLQKMWKHAKEVFENHVEKPASERVQDYQRFLKIENRRLLSAHREGVSGLDVAQARSTMMDGLLRYIFKSASLTTAKGNVDPKKLDLCLVTTGGYGRGELNPFSDVDILFLLSKARGPELAQINTTVEQVLYMLWDLGLKVGHATRTISECIDQAKKDMQSRTSLMESRYLDGSEKVFKDFHETIHRECIRGHVDEYIADRLKDQAQRHKKYGGTVFVQEPNIKQGCGGLRDLQSLLWISRLKHGVGTLKELQEKHLIGPIETGRLTRAYDFLMRVRNELHYSNGRAADEITLSAQPKIAYALGYHEKDVLQRIETFMRDYYRHARDIFVLTEIWTEKFLQNHKSGKLKKLSHFIFGNKYEKLDHGLILQNGILEISTGAAFPHKPHDLIQVFRTAQIWNARIGAGLQSTIRKHLKMINREFLYSKRESETFISILQSKGEVGRILRAMHECGVLDEYIPEFGKLDCLVQHEFYHRYTTDEHTLVAIEKLDEVLRSTTNPYARYSRIFQQIERPHLLYLAILLHDTGKAVRVRHHSDASAECARRVSRRLGLDAESSRILLFLVDHHATMSNLAQRRDIEDPTTIEDLRSLTQTQERLDMLHLLTFVDGLAVGSNVWNEWRQTLLWQLHENTSHAINSSGVEKVDIQTVREKLKASIHPKIPPHILDDEVESHFSCMPERYWRRIDQETLLSHLETLHLFFEKLLETELIGTSPIVTWKHFPDRGYSEATVCSWDRHGLFSKIAGSFTAARVNILSADIYTRSDNLVLDIFHVCDLEHRSISSQTQMEKVQKILTSSLTETKETPFVQLIQREYESMRHVPYQQEETFPTQVTFNNEDSKDYTILEIQTPDRLGLLYQVLKILSDCELNISLARINTEKGAAMDAFYLTNTEGKKILDANYLQSIQKQLVETINRINQPFRVTSA